MKQSSLHSTSLSPGLQRFFRPMLVISLGLHTIFLFTPLSSQPQLEPEPSPEEETVNITSLVAPPPQASPKPYPKATPKPSPKQVSPTPPPPSPKKVAPPPPPKSAPPPPPPPIEKSKPKPLEEPELPEEEKQLEEPEPLEEEKQPEEPEPLEEEKQPEEPEPPEPEAGEPEDADPVATAQESGSALMTELRTRVRAKLAGDERVNSSATIEDFFDALPYSEIDQRDYFFQTEDQLKDGAIGSLGITQTNPGLSYVDYVEPVLQGQLGFEIDQIFEGYGDEEFYKAYNDQGVEFYMSLVGVGLGSSQTFVVIWATDPRTIETD